MKSEVRQLFEEAVECMNLTDREKEKFLPIWRKNREIFVRIIVEYADEKFQAGKNQNIELLQT